MSVRILHGDCREVMQRMIDCGTLVDCVVTSPPYWGLRDYGVEGQLGLEKTLGEHIAIMVEVFGLVRQLLKPEGTLWLNYGDCYAATPNGRSAADVKAAGKDDRTFRDKPFSTIGPIYDPEGGKKLRCKNSDKQSRNKGSHHEGRIFAGGFLKPKDLCMIPNRLAIALQDDGWWVRSEIIWHKPNPMPESVCDRPSSAHEKVFLLTKSDKYFYDYEAVRTGLKESSVSRLAQDVKNQKGSTRANGGRKTNGAMKAVGGKQRGHGRRHAGFNDRWDAMNRKEQQSNGANLRNVWTIATAAFDDAHFATFPPDLVERCIKAGCPKGGIVFDPFGGAGTTGLVADRLQRNAILIDLNEQYAEMARKRISGDAPMFAEITA